MQLSSLPSSKRTHVVLLGTSSFVDALAQCHSNHSLAFRPVTNDFEEGGEEPEYIPISQRNANQSDLQEDGKKKFENLLKSKVMPRGMPFLVFFSLLLATTKYIFRIFDTYDLT